MDEVARDAVRQRLSEALGSFAPVAWTIDAQKDRIAPFAGVRLKELTLVSPDGERARAYLAGPDQPWQNLPAILYCHAHGGKYDIGIEELLTGRPALVDPPYGLAFSAAGFVTLCIEMPCFGSRAFETESFRTKRELWHGRTLFGRMLAEQAGALALLKATQGVDPGRIGVFGLSMGATLAFWLGALQPEIRAVAHECSLADLNLLVAGGGHDRHGIYMTVPGLLQLARTGEIAGLIAPRPQLATMGALDPLTPPDALARAIDDLEAAYRNAGASDALDIVVSASTGHVETAEMRARVLALFSRVLQS